MNKHRNTVLINLEVSDVFAKELIDHSYELVFSSLTKKIQEEVSKL
jgi:predicted DNA-binding protein (MmcQ/YjbR family)